MPQWFANVATLHHCRNLLVDQEREPLRSCSSDRSNSDVNWVSGEYFGLITLRSVIAAYKYALTLYY